MANNTDIYEQGRSTRYALFLTNNRCSCIAFYYINNLLIAVWWLEIIKIPQEERIVQELYEDLFI